MRSAVAIFILPAALLAGCHEGSTGGTHLAPGGSALLEVTGSAPEVTILNSGTTELHVMIGYGEAAADTVIIPAGVTRWWYPDGSRMFRFENRSAKALGVSWRIVRAGFALYQPAPSP